MVRKIVISSGVCQFANEFEKSNLLQVSVPRSIGTAERVRRSAS